MALRNRVQPDGALTDAGRGTFTGNRGILHVADKVMGAALWKHRAWICCTLEWQGRTRDVMTGRNWTELFFLDEAVAMAAGHRPCAYCRRPDYNRFVSAWSDAHGTRPKAPQLDAILHRTRAEPGARNLRTHSAQAEDLPDGVFIRADTPLLLRGDMALPYTPHGYGPPQIRPDGCVTVLTAPPMIETFHAGYAPALHQTVQSPLFT